MCSFVGIVIVGMDDVDVACVDVVDDMVCVVVVTAVVVVVTAVVVDADSERTLQIISLKISFTDPHLPIYEKWQFVSSYDCLLPRKVTNVCAKDFIND